MRGGKYRYLDLDVDGGQILPNRWGWQSRIPSRIARHAALDESQRVPSSDEVAAFVSLIEELEDARKTQFVSDFCFFGTPHGLVPHTIVLNLDAQRVTGTDRTVRQSIAALPQADGLPYLAARTGPEDGLGRHCQEDRHDLIGTLPTRASTGFP